MSKKVEMNERVRRELEHASLMGVVAAIKEADLSSERVWEMLGSLQGRSEFTDRVKKAVAPILAEFRREFDSAA